MVHPAQASRSQPTDEKARARLSAHNATMRTIESKNLQRHAAATPLPTYEQLAVGRVLRRHRLHDQPGRLCEPLRALNKALRHRAGQGQGGEGEVVERDSSVGQERNAPAAESQHGHHSQLVEPAPSSSKASWLIPRYKIKPNSELTAEEGAMPPLLSTTLQQACTHSSRHSQKQKHSLSPRMRAPCRRAWPLQSCAAAAPRSCAAPPQAHLRGTKEWRNMLVCSPNTASALQGWN